MNHLITAYGYYAVALLVGAESLGIPLPGETILIAAAIYAGHTHQLSVWIIFAVAAAAAILGDNIGSATKAATASCAAMAITFALTNPS
jgi:membrane protein DedA with SNARE-associated domain